MMEGLSSHEPESAGRRSATGGGDQADPLPSPREAEEHRRDDVLERQAPGARVIHAAIRREGEEELQRSRGALAWSGLAAGLSMGLSLLFKGLIESDLPDLSWRPLLSNWGYAIGFLVVILGRQQLFTENTLTPILPLLHERSTRLFGKVAQLWAIVLAANLVGTAAFAWTLASTSFFPPEAHEAFATVGREAIRHPFWPTLVGAIFAGWMIALMVWLLPFAETSRTSVVLLMAYLVGLGGFAHIIAGSGEVLYLVATGAATWGEYLLRFFTPALLGNVIGGVTLVTMVNHAQVAAGRE